MNLEHLYQACKDTIGFNLAAMDHVKVKTFHFGLWTHTD